jgi:hypothetical protein
MEVNYMLTEPQTVTINAVAHALARVQSGSVLTNTPSVYQSPDETVSLTITNQKTKAGRLRPTVRLDVRALVADPLGSGSQDFDSVSHTYVIDRPEYGFTVTQVDQHVAAFKTWLTSTIVGKLYGNES